jgi:antitoxin component YwqK of YwqJK toxin-antitoxin module
MVFLVSCGSSDEEKRQIAAITCSIMSETRNMDGAVRVEKINEAREKIGGEAFLSGDDKIKESFELGLCETLVVDSDQYEKMVAAIEANVRQKEEEERIARERAEEKRIARTRDALEEWKLAILDRINSASDIIKDATFDVSSSDVSPMKIEYNCSVMTHLDHTLIVSFDNELGTLEGRNSVGYCSGYQKLDAITLDFEDSDRENLYSVIDSKTRGSLLDSVISVDLKINDAETTGFIANTAKQRAEFKYVDPTNYHPDLRNWDLRNSPVTVTIYNREERRKIVAEKTRVAAEKTRVADNTPTVKEEFYSDGTLQDRSNFQSKNDGGKRHGSRERYHRNGQLWEKLNYANGELDGYAEVYFDNGQVEKKVNYRKGQLTGLNSWYKNDGRISETSDYGDGTRKDYQDGKADLLYVGYVYHPNKQLKSKLLLKNGEKHGISEFFYEDGQLKTIGTYTNGKMDGLISEYFENGEVEVNGIVKNGEKDGLFEWFYESGQLKVTTTYTNGQLDGFRTVYHDNGEIEMKGIYKNGEKDGLFEWFYESGQPKHISTYINGQQDGFETAYHDNGEIELKGIYKNGEYDGLFEWFDEKGKKTSQECRMDGTVNQKFICRKDHPINP